MTSLLSWIWIQMALTFTINLCDLNSQWSILNVYMQHRKHFKKLLEMEVQVIFRPPSFPPLSPNSAHLSFLSATHPDKVSALPPRNLKKKKMQQRTSKYKDTWPRGYAVWDMGGEETLARVTSTQTDHHSVQQHLSAVSQTIKMTSLEQLLSHSLCLCWRHKVRSSFDKSLEAHTRLFVASQLRQQAEKLSGMCVCLCDFGGRG